MPDFVRAPEPWRDAGAALTGLRREPVRRPSLGSGRALSDLLDRLVDSGAVVSGDVIIGLAGVDLIRLDLRLLLIGAQSAIEAGAGAQLRPASAFHRDRPDSAGEAIEGAVINGDEAAERGREHRRVEGRAEP